ncbi:hypothetical protein BT96DRAFT_812666 [Gymnopus androsaceus JB14]|uniref:Uncharacterized protein n=1 Tax=Gymnopus androsaceus JB14 TaxID=1447944 RepID=A0A6A4I7V5_9AGAR|nr:hypothetical protein BT96DRAFT_812666 [Gymnopus androsaceus JB14]
MSDNESRISGVVWSNAEPALAPSAEPSLNGLGVDLDPSTPEPVSTVSLPPSLFPRDLSVPGPATYLRDDLFYEDHRIFLVENCLFRVPINGLAAESQIFRGMMEFPASGNEGLSDQNPIRLDGVSRDDFRQLLRVLCPPKRFNAPAPILSFSEWTSVLKLADMWLMDEVREHAISCMAALPNIDPIDKIVVGREFNILSWLAPCFNEILQRSQSFTERDLDLLGIPTFLLLVDFRNRLTFTNDYNYGTSWHLGTKRQATAVDFTQVIKAELPDFQGKFFYRILS